MLKNLFHQADIPAEYRSNFIHLYFDMGWFGVLSGSAVNFLNVYAARLGATGLQIGLLAAVSAVMNLIFAMPAGRWLEQRPIGKAVFWTSVFYRLGFALWIPLPWLFGNEGQIWALILIALYMGIPLTALAVGFNALFAEAVPINYRAQVAGTRNILLSVTFMLTSIISGYLLDHLAFPMGYQVVFAIGFFGAAMSSVHLFFVRPLNKEATPPPSIPQLATVNKNPSIPRPWQAALRLDIWQTEYRNHLLVLLGFHLSQYLAIPLFSIFLVDHLHLSDDTIGLGTAFFYLAMLIGSMRLRQIVNRIGHKALTGWGVAGMALYPIVIAFSTQAWHYYVASLIGGFVWAMVGGAYANYLLEHTPINDRPSHLAWYNVVLNAAILFGSLAGPAIANVTGIVVALFVFGILRILAGMAILKWG
ncbi:MAG TPA: MFS transporter [Anaerolineales bacterium]|nr:MFS transporter [Anaerolineales bacterium]